MTNYHHIQGNTLIYTDGRNRFQTNQKRLLLKQNLLFWVVSADRAAFLHSNYDQGNYAKSILYAPIKRLFDFFNLGIIESDLTLEIPLSEITNFRVKLTT